jgi:hypothetical protein
MKKIVTALFVSIIFFTAFAQDKPTVTWFGVDFTKAKMIGKRGSESPKQYSRIICVNGMKKFCDKTGNSI